MNADNTKPIRRKAILVGVQQPDVTDADHQASLEELGRLVHTLGFDVAATVTQKRASPLNATIIGEGKLKELAQMTGGTGVVESKLPAHRRKNQNELEAEDTRSAAELAREAAELEDPVEPIAEVVVFDHELTPSQLHNLETATGVEVLDRTGVIVEIFHRHAHTREARIQVEIARLRYIAPRMRLSKARGNREGGGIGSKGVGETSYELDKRRIRDRIAELSKELEEIHKNDQGRRDRRRDQAKIALVGYTNAGKSSLMRALTGSDVLVEDKLFATLDTTIRAMQPESQPRVLVSDTVGFIKKLPHDLVASFRSTLDEARDASLLLYVVDGSDATFRSQLQVTKTVLTELDAAASPSFLILNKMDRLDDDARRRLKLEFPEAIQLSAKSVDDVRALRDKILGFFEENMTDTEILIPFHRGDLLGDIRKSMRVLGESHSEDGTTVKVKSSADALSRIRKALESKRA